MRRSERVANDSASRTATCADPAAASPTPAPKPLKKRVTKKHIEDPDEEDDDEGAGGLSVAERQFLRHVCCQRVQEADEAVRAGVSIHTQNAFGRYGSVLANMWLLCVLRLFQHAEENTHMTVM